MCIVYIYLNEFSIIIVLTEPSKATQSLSS